MPWPSSPYKLHGRHFYMGRLIGQVIPHFSGSHLMHLGRKMFEYPEHMLAALKIQPGMTVADVGVGIGYDTLRLARLVGPDGRVFASEVQYKMLHKLMKNASRHGLAQTITPVLASHHDANLPPNSFDLILMVDVYHECIDPPAILKGLRRALKPNGRLVLVEYRLEDSWIPNVYDDHRMSLSQAKLELELNGFVLRKALEFLPSQHILIFTKV